MVSRKVRIKVTLEKNRGYLDIWEKGATGKIRGYLAIWEKCDVGQIRDTRTFWKKGALPKCGCTWKFGETCHWENSGVNSGKGDIGEIRGNWEMREKYDTGKFEGSIHSSKRGHCKNWEYYFEIFSKGDIGKKRG